MEIRKNNFDFLRLLFACFVIITHSYTLSGSEKADFLCQISNGYLTFSYFGVKGFFVISGYLIFQSFQRSESVTNYMWKRILRLFPALIVVLLLTVLLVPLVYESNIPILKNREFLTYFPNNLILYRNQYHIAGVFESNPYKSSINGSIWTIAYEFTMYLLLALLFVFKKKELFLKWTLILLFSLLVVANIYFYEDFEKINFILNGLNLIDLSCFFIGGSLLSIFKIENFRNKKLMLLMTLGALILSIYFDFYNFSKHIILPFLFLLIGLIPVKYVYDVGNKIGDLSYGIYLYGFPIQQTLMYFFKFNYFELIIFSLPISIFFAYFSWNIIEKKALSFKNLIH